MGFLQLFLGPYTSKVWRNFSREIEGTYERKWSGTYEIRAVYERRQISISFDPLERGRGSIVFRIAYQSPRPFEFEVYPSDMFTDIFVSRRILTGDSNMDNYFIIKSSDEQKVKGLFADASIRTSAARHSPNYIAASHRSSWWGPWHRPKRNELCVVLNAGIAEISHLRGGFALLTNIHNRLCQLDQEDAQ